MARLRTPGRTPGAPMEYAPYIAAIAALIAYGLLYRRRKVPKLIRRCNCVCAVLPGGDPIDDFVHFYRSEILESVPDLEGRTTVAEELEQGDESL